MVGATSTALRWGYVATTGSAQGVGTRADRSSDLVATVGVNVLKEADLMADGRHLGPVGGRIVGEVILGLLQADPRSWVSAQPTWRPTLPAAGGDGRSFRMTDFLRFAEVDPASRGQ